MNNHPIAKRALLTLTSLLIGMNLSGFAMPQDNVSKAIATTVMQSENIDTTAPVIEALDIKIPYGTSLLPEQMASISDDQDKSPILEIASVTKISDAKSKDSNSTVATSTTSTEATTAATADPALSVAASNEPHNNTISRTTENSDSILAEISNNGQTKQANVASTEAAAASEPKSAQKDDKGYLFNEPGKYQVDLTGTDRSGNQSQKSITVTVTDNTIPVISGLHENFVITDKDTKAPNYLEDITAVDEIDGDITSSIKVDDSQVQYGTPGSYFVKYSVSDASRNTAPATTPVIINDTTAPVITLSKTSISKTVIDSKPNYSFYVSKIEDVNDGNVKDSMTVDDSSVNYKKPGKYNATIQAKDKSGNTAESTLEVITTAGWITKSRQKYYYSPEDGHLYHDWSHIDGKVYYFAPSDGHMLTGLQTIDGKQYLLDSKDGHRVSGWQTLNGKKYYFSTDDGHMYHDWSNVNGEEYYFSPSDGHMMTGLLTISGRQYLLDSDDGHQVTGWQTIDGKEYYFSPDDGHMYHDWSNINGQEYYFDPDEGYMYTGTHYVDGEQYNFGTSGVAKKVETQQTRSVSNSSSGYSYIGNRNTGVFHYSGCSSVNRMKESNKVWFDSRSDAVNNGYRPCQRCNP